MSAALVFAAAPLTPTPRLRARLASLDQPYVVAADAGAATALAFGITPDLVIGDFDSLDARVLAELQRRQITIETHPRDKDATDGQLAVERALERRPSGLYLLGFLGGPRLDQLLANVLLLTRIEARAVLLDERNEALVLRGSDTHAWIPEPGEVVSLIPLEEVRGVRSEGLRWPLGGDTLHVGDTRGISNEPSADQARVSLESGVLLVTRHFAR